MAICAPDGWSGNANLLVEGIESVSKHSLSSLRLIHMLTFLKRFQIGAIIGVVLAGPLTSRIGYRWAFISNLMLLNGFIFVFYFADSLPVMLAAQLLEGVPWGVFIANSPAYCSEIVPIPLRAPATQMLQMFWAIGAIIVQGVTYNYNDLDSEIAYRYGPATP